jgi:membrane protease YdiL (CAAX protease family)
LSTGLLLVNLGGRAGPSAYFPDAGALVAGVVISVAEEVGWRGYALPRLEERFAPFAASVLLGIAWSLWHVPMFVGQGIPLGVMPLMLILLVGGSLLMTFIAHGTGGSLLLAVVAHLAAHLNNSNRALPQDATPLVVHAIAYAGLGLLVMRSPIFRRRAEGRA